MDEKPAPDRSVGRIAAHQHGVIATAQLNAIGIRRGGLAARLATGRMYRVHQGVYAVGHPALGEEGRWMAAVLACGGRAVLSHRSAAALWGLLPAKPGPIHVTIPGGGGRGKRRGIQRHRARSLTTAEITHRRGIPVTTPARTIADLRKIASAAELRRALREAAVLGLDVGGKVDSDPTRSELEHRFLRLCRRHQLLPPEVNVRVGGLRVDFLWPQSSLIVETDGYRYHRGQQAFEDDRARDADLRMLGYEVVRFSYRQVCDEPARVAAVLRKVLAQRSARATGQASN